jgi:hypothetical protein
MVGRTGTRFRGFPSAIAPDHHIRATNPSATDVISTNSGDALRQLAQSRTLDTSTASRHRYHWMSPPSRNSFDPCTPHFHALHSILRTRRHERRTSTWAEMRRLSCTISHVLSRNLGAQDTKHYVPTLYQPVIYAVPGCETHASRTVGPQVHNSSTTQLMHISTSKEGACGA